MCARETFGLHLGLRDRHYRLQLIRASPLHARCPLILPVRCARHFIGVTEALTITSRSRFARRAIVTASVKRPRTHHTHTHARKDGERGRAACTSATEIMPSRVCTLTYRECTVMEHTGPSRGTRHASPSQRQGCLHRWGNLRAGPAAPHTHCPRVRRCGCVRTCVCVCCVRVRAFVWVRG